MHSTRVVGLLLLFSIAAMGCSSSDGGGTGGSTGATGGAGGSATGGAAGGAGGEAGQAGTSGSTDCNPACGAGSVCVGSGIEGGAVFLADGGMCPPGRHLQGNACVQDLSYACMPIPSGCNGTVSCSCAGTLCATLHTCNVQSPGEITCIEAVP